MRPRLAATRAAWTTVSPRRADLCRSSAASHAQMQAIHTQKRYSAQKNRATPVRTPSHEQHSATTAGARVHDGESRRRTPSRRAVSPSASSPTVATARPAAGTLKRVFGPRHRKAPSSATFRARYRQDAANTKEQPVMSSDFRPKRCSRCSLRQADFSAATAAARLRSSATANSESAAARGRRHE
eukprot:scaffold121832_cov63-Phaeocystis_antarctica.AAC.4